MMLYMKKGRRYVPVKEFTGFPSEGIWWVQRKPGKSENRWIAKLSELPVVSTIAKLESFRDDVIKAMNEVRGRNVFGGKSDGQKWYSDNGLVDAIFRVLARKIDDREAEESRKAGRTW